MHRAHGRELAKLMTPAPGREGGDGACIGLAGVRVAEVGGEEFEDALGGPGIRRQERRERDAVSARPGPDPGYDQLLGHVPFPLIHAR